MTSGTLAGTIVGVVAVVSLVAAGCFFWWQKTKRRKLSGDSTSEQDGDAKLPSELVDTGRRELGGRPIVISYEMMGEIRPPPVELPQPAISHELKSNEQPH
jgi:hypothetical protein